IQGEQPAVLDHHPAADHDAVDRGRVLGVDELVYGIVERHEIDRPQVEEDEVGLVTGGEPAEARGAERSGTACGRGARRLPGGAAVKRGPTSPSPSIWASSVLP